MSIDDLSEPELTSPDRAVITDPGTEQGNREQPSSTGLVFTATITI